MEIAFQVLLPGDRVLTELPKTGKLRLAPGVHVLDGDKVIATHAGVLNQAKSGKLWLKTTQKRSTPRSILRTCPNPPAGTLQPWEKSSSASSRTEMQR